MDSSGSAAMWDYGKTEVAIRAAFKADAGWISRWCVLVPTTILAQQHYNTFVQRMKDFPGDGWI